MPVCPLTSDIRHLVIASHNAGKVAEIGAMLAPLGMKVTSAAEANIPEPEETGTTFAENAILKAEHTMKASGFPALADDSGLVVPAIGGAPGIYSARWAGPDKNFQRAFNQIEAALADNAPDNRKPDAYFICALALTIPPPVEGRPGGGHTCSIPIFSSSQGSPHPTPSPKGEGVTYTFEGRIDGRLIFPPRGGKGFGYDPIFIPDGYEITFAEIDPEIKNRISHRARAFAKFLEHLKGR